MARAEIQNRTEVFKNILRLGRWTVEAANYRHGHAAKYRVTPSYRTWMSMKARCLNSNTKEWSRYGGRGITVCERWLGEHGFVNFLSDMGERPEGKTISRYLDSGNYEPANCEWATSAQQGAERKGRAAMRRLHAYHE